MALVDYITGMNNAIQTRKFFGKGDKLEDSIGAYTRDLLDQGIISPEEEVKLKQILKARFNQKGVAGLVQDAKNIAEKLGLDMNFIDAYFNYDQSQLLFSFLSTLYCFIKEYISKIAIISKNMPKYFFKSLLSNLKDNLLPTKAPIIPEKIIIFEIS